MATIEFDDRDHFEQYLELAERQGNIVIESYSFVKVCTPEDQLMGVWSSNAQCGWFTDTPEKITDND